MDVIHYFRHLPGTITRTEFLKMYDDYSIHTNLTGQILFQMKSVSHLELNAQLFKFYCSDKILNSYQQHVLINYIGKMTFAIKLHHSSMSNEDLDFRRAFVEFVKYANTRITIEGEYWFRIVLNALMMEQHIGLATIYIDILDSVYSCLDLKDKTVCTRRIMCKQDLPNLMDYCLKMYHSQHQSITWPLFVDTVISIIHRCCLYYRKVMHCNGGMFDSKLLHILFLFLNHDDNQELFMDILQLINTVIFNNMIDYNPFLYQELFTTHNLMAISNLPNQFQNEEKDDIQLEILTLFILIFQLDNIMISKKVIQHTCSQLSVYADFSGMTIVFKFISIAFKYYSDICYNLTQIRQFFLLIQEEDVPNELVHIFLNHLLDIFLYTSGKISNIQLGMQKDVFSNLVYNYQFLTITSKSRMIMALVVYEFMKIGHVHPELEYQEILKKSGYLYMLEEDSNIYNRDVLLKIKYNYVCTSLQDKCKEWVLDNPHHYDYEDIANILDIL